MEYRKKDHGQRDGTGRPEVLGSLSNPGADLSMNEIRECIPIPLSLCFHLTNRAKTDPEVRSRNSMCS